jgi:hypothetical protein
MALAIVSESPLAPASNFNRAGDELIQARSVADALRQLSVAKNARKIMVVSTAFDTQAVPEGIQVVKRNHRSTHGRVSSGPQSVSRSSSGASPL